MKLPLPNDLYGGYPAPHDFHLEPDGKITARIVFAHFLNSNLKHQLAKYNKKQRQIAILQKLKKKGKHGSKN